MKKTFNTHALYAVLNTQREARKVSWKEIARQTGVSQSTLSRLGNGKGLDIDSLMNLLAWCQIDVRDFLQPPLNEAINAVDCLTQITAMIFADNALSVQQARMLDAVIREVYAFCTMAKE